ncbi:Succinyl-CoA--L-malate CoA-transferase alpha subunit [Methylobacterium crusticola]|uniref:Succinyl-CoA--L-malate CoA-transferase alpha subunit n=1 Tax=Methylobacterium crusticola TaxID=1697972 RepID=A0ABQ4R3E2_9HYPH|nr:CoA transferase [Methylobacterium crusticola]GJD52138.1 Succinyl-CoA--L-malate CoA-transferase alpha subunit [Methylobacterium crusticola]
MAEQTTGTGPLSDLRVVEMGQLLAGPFCGQLFADFGAEVIKVEAPGIGDPMREWGQKDAGTALWWPVVARNKKSVEIDAREPDGQALIRDLVARSDVLIENFRPGTLERWGLGYEALAALNPGLVMIRVSGYGQTGPYAHKAGYGSIGEAMGGMRYVVGDPSTPPSRSGISIGDTLAATFACLGGMMAIHARARTGRGQVVDSAIYEAVLAVMESLVTDYDRTGYIRERTGAILPRIAPSNVYPTRDGIFVLIAANMDSVFKRLAAAMGRPELADDPRFATHTARGENQAELDATVSAWTGALGREELGRLLDDHGVPRGDIYRAPEMLEDAHFKARQAIVDVLHPQLGTLKMQNVAPRLSETPGAVRTPGPALGQHNAEVLRDLLGLDAARLEALAGRGVVGAAPPARTAAA